MNQALKLLTVLILLNIMVVASAKASTIKAEDLEIKDINETEILKIKLDSAPQGLSGYNISLSVIDKSIVTIKSIIFPTWATLHRNSSLPSLAVWIKAADLNKQVESGETDILLAEIKIESQKIGETSINISTLKLDDDNGYPIIADTENVEINVRKTEGGDVENNSDNNPSYYPSEGNSPVNKTKEENLLPIANVEESYYGLTNQVITFNGSDSYDPDGGNIIFWNWEFGDKTNGTGKIINHTYKKPGVYTVELTIIDDENTKAYSQFNLSITQANTSQSMPEIKGNTVGTKNTTYQYEIISTKIYNDTTNFTINWGDGTQVNISGVLIGNNTTYKVYHKWNSAGKYTVTLTMDDNNNITQNEKIIFIDAKNIEDIGYITDENADGIYDKFQNDEGIKTNLEERKGQYLIDNNNDGEWDYIYSNENGLNVYKNEELIDHIWTILVLSVLTITVITAIIVYLYKKNNSKEDMESAK